jgi:maleate cis-trans isomerase
MMSVKNRIGFIVPSLNVVAEDSMIRMSEDYARNNPAIGVHFTRANVDVSQPLAVQFQSMVDTAPDHGLSLGMAGVSVIAFTCTSASIFKGPGFDRKISESIAKVTGIPAVSTASAVLEALEALNIKRVAVATPYVEWVYAAERDFLQAAGFEVTAVNGMDRRGGAEINTISADEILKQADEVVNDEAEALFVSCTDLPVIDLIQKLEERYSRPVLTSNQVTFWSCAKRLGLGAFEGYGQLMRNYL